MEFNSNRNSNTFKTEKLIQLDDKTSRRLLYKYANIYEMCIEDIKHRHAVGQKMLLFEPPSKLPNEPDFDIMTCLRFIMEKLRKGGFTVYYKEPIELLILWNNATLTTKKIENIKYFSNEIKKTDGVRQQIIDSSVRMISGGNPNNQNLLKNNQNLLKNNQNLLKNDDESRMIEYKPSGKPSGKPNDDILFPTIRK